MGLRVTLIWFTLAAPLLCFPLALPVTSQNMNCKSPLETTARTCKSGIGCAWTLGLMKPDASVVFVGFALIAFIWYLVRGRTHYRGPPNSHTGL